MKPVHALASRRHYIDHLLPIWQALEPDERGTFYVTSRECRRHALSVGLPVQQWPRGDTLGRRTAIDGHHPHVLVASYHDLVELGQRRRAVLVEHGAGQHYGGDGGTIASSPYYSGGSHRGRVDVFLCPNEVVARRNAAVYPKAVCAVVGCPKLAGMADWRDAHHAQRQARSRPLVGITFHWDCQVGRTAGQVPPEAGWAWPDYRDALEQLAAEPTRPFDLVGHAHPRAASVLRPWWARTGVPYADTLGGLLAQVDVLVADNTSAMWEAAALDVPVVVLNARAYRRDVHHGLRFWEYADVGVQVNHPTALGVAISETLLADPQADRRRQIATELYGDWACSRAKAHVAATVLRNSLP